MTGLLVFWDQKIVGTLTRHKRGKVVFQYNKDWLASDGRSISISLPCQQEKFAPGVSTAFFENLLPESRARSILAHNYRFDKKDTFAFLNTFGEDCAGALSIIPEEKEPDFTTGQYKCIDSELIEILNKIEKDPKKHSLYPEIKDVRLSIAGVQDKLPVYLKDGRFYLPLNSGSATTHIIKPANADYPELTKNGDTYRVERIKIHSLEKFAKTMNFRLSFLHKIIEETLTAVGYQLAPLLGKHEKQYGKSTVYDELYEKIQENMRSMKKNQ